MVRVDASSSGMLNTSSPGQSTFGRDASDRKVVNIQRQYLVQFSATQHLQEKGSRQLLPPPPSAEAQANAVSTLMLRYGVARHVKGPEISQHPSARDSGLTDTLFASGSPAFTPLSPLCPLFSTLLLSPGSVRWRPTFTSFATRLLWWECVARLLRPASSPIWPRTSH